MPILKLNLNFALTIRSKFHHFSDSKTNCLLRCAPTLYINLLVISDRNRTLGVQLRKQAKIRFCQHLAISPRTDNRVSVPQHSAPRDHCHSNSHPFKFHNFTIIDSAATVSDLRILESLYIFKCRPSLNSDQSSVPLHCF